MTRLTQFILFSSLAVIAVLLLGFYLNFNPTQHDFFPKCMFHSLTGLHCPGCGSQRAVHAILNGDILSGLRHNILIIFAILVLGYQAFRLILAHYYPQNTTNLLNHPKTPWIILGVIVAFWILRNIPILPFSYLAP